MAKEIMKDVNAGAKDMAAAVKRDVSPIREDLETLKADARVLRDDARNLASHVKEEGSRQYARAEERARDMVEDYKERGREMMDEAKVRGRDGYAELASFVSNNPGQSLAIAFVGGMIASMLFGNRRS